MQMQEAVILSKANLRSKSSICNLALGIASPTRYFSNAQCVNELIPSFTSYLIVPATPTPLIYNQYQIILGVLPQTKNILLDLALPFYNMGNQYEQGYYFGRYLIYNQRLIGIRLSCSTKSKLFDQYETYKKWPMRKIAKYKVPKCILDFYRKNKFEDKTCLKQIKIGDFNLSFKNVRIRLLFESQLKNSQSLLNESLQLGCQIVSVINDIPRQKIFQGKLRGSNYSFGLPIQNMLKQFARKNKKIVMYTGCKIAPLTELYLTNPFIIHFDLPQIKMEPHFLNFGGTLTAICTIEMSKYQIFREKPSEIKQIYNIVVNQSLRQIKSVKPGKINNFNPEDSSFYGLIPEQMENILKKMHLWHIYNSINQRSPFIIPLPLSLFTLMIEMQFKQIAKYTSKPLKTYLMYFKSSKDYIIAEQQQNSSIKIYDSFADLVAQQKREKYFVYTEAPSQILLMAKTFQQKNKIFVCEKQLLMEEQLQRNRQIQNIEKKMMKFCDKIMEFGISSLKKIYKDNRLSPEPLTKDQLIVALNDYLKAKIRASVRCHPFYKFVINLNRHQLQQALGQIEIQVFEQEKNNNNNLQNSMNNMSTNNNLSITFGQERKNVDTKGKQFFIRLQNLKKIYGDNQKTSQNQCHRCLKYYPKQYVKSCQNCHTRTCYLCHELIRGKQSSIENYKQCLVCKKLCFCGLCTKKKKSQQKQRQKINASSLEIRNLSLSQPQKTLKQLEELQMQKKLDANACQICEIQGRQIQFIQIVCSQCDAKKCYNCVKAKQKDRKFIANWLCNQCKPAPVPTIPIPSRTSRNRIEEQNQLDPNEPNLSPISHSKSDDKRKKNQHLNQYQNKGKQRKRSASHSMSPQRIKKSGSKNVVNEDDRNKKNKGGSPSHSKSPPIRRNIRRSPSNEDSPDIRGKKKSQLVENPKQRANNQNNEKQIQSSKKHKNKSPSHSQSPIRVGKKAKQPQQPVSPKVTKGSRKQSASQSASPVIKKQEKKKPAKNSPSQSKSPPRKLENKKKVQSPSASKSPQIPVRKNRNESPSQQKSKQKHAKETGRKKPKSPSNSNSNSPVNARKKKANSRSRSRSADKKSGDRSHGMTSAPLWGKQSNQNKNRDRQGQNTSYQQRDNYHQGNQNNRQPYNDRGGYQRNNQGNWRGGRGRGQQRGRGGDRGRGRGRGYNNDNQGGQQQGNFGNRNYGNRQSNDNRSYNRNQTSYNQENRRQYGREQVQAENKIVAIDEPEVNENMDY